MNGFLHFQLKPARLPKQNHVIISNYKPTQFYFEIAPGHQTILMLVAWTMFPLQFSVSGAESLSWTELLVRASSVKYRKYKDVNRRTGRETWKPLQAFHFCPVPSVASASVCVWRASKASCHMPAHFSDFACTCLRVYSYAYMHTRADDIRSVFSASCWKQSAWRRGRIVTLTPLNSN